MHLAQDISPILVPAGELLAVRLLLFEDRVKTAPYFFIFVVGSVEYPCFSADQFRRVPIRRRL